MQCKYKLICIKEKYKKNHESIGKCVTIWRTGNFEQNLKKKDIKRFLTIFFGGEGAGQFLTSLQKIKSARGSAALRIEIQGGGLYSLHAFELQD